MQHRCFVGKPKYHDMIFLPYLPPLLCIQHVFLCSFHRKLSCFSVLPSKTGSSGVCVILRPSLSGWSYSVLDDFSFHRLRSDCSVSLLPNANERQQDKSSTRQSSRRCILLSAEKWYCVLLCVRIPTYCLSHSGSSQKLEMDELGPGQAVYYTWAEPTGSRVLCWSWGPYSAELKNEEVSTHLNTWNLFMFIGNKYRNFFIRN